MIDLTDICFDPSAPGSEEVVYWRRIPVGFIRKYRKKGTADAEYHSKWYSELMFCGFHDTKEQAALTLVTKYVEQNREHPLVVAALHKNWGEVDRIKEDICQKYGIIKPDEKDINIVRKEVHDISTRILQRCEQLRIDEKIQAALLKDVPLGVACRIQWLKPSSYQEIHHFIKQTIVDFQIEMITSTVSIKTMRKHMDNAFLIGYECFRKIEKDALPSQNTYKQWVGDVADKLLGCPPDGIVTPLAKRSFQATCKKFLHFLRG